jgi:hypothetical protein
MAPCWGRAPSGAATEASSGSVRLRRQAWLSQGGRRAFRTIGNFGLLDTVGFVATASQDSLRATVHALRPAASAQTHGSRRDAPTGRVRFANRLAAWIEVDGGEITGSGYSGGLIMGVTPLTAGPFRLMLPTKRNPEIRHEPQVIEDEVTFVQTVGNRPGFSIVRPSVHWPFILTRPFTIWTTVELTIQAEGSARQRLVGASPFPRHWLYDDGGELVEKAALTRASLWLRTVFGTHTPWGGEDEAPVTAQPESEVERALSEQIMRGDCGPAIRSLQAGDFLFRQAEEATSIALILDGNFEVRVDDEVVGRVGPGTVVGERAALEGGRRTADLRALTDARVGEVAAQSLNAELLNELSLGHHREHDG